MSDTYQVYQFRATQLPIGIGLGLGEYMELDL